MSMAILATYVAILKKYFRKCLTIFESFKIKPFKSFPRYGIIIITALQVYVYTYSCRVELHGLDHIQGRCFTFSLGHEKSESTLSNITVTIIL